jgi:hypothetical protein
MKRRRGHGVGMPLALPLPDPCQPTERVRPSLRLLRAGVTGWRRSVGQDSGALRPEGHNRSRMLAITYRHFNGPCERRLVERL